jgi:hypothetical protein
MVRFETSLGKLNYEVIATQELWLVQLPVLFRRSQSFPEPVHDFIESLHNTGRVEFIEGHQMEDIPDGHDEGHDEGEPESFFVIIDEVYEVYVRDWTMGC